MIVTHAKVSGLTNPTDPDLVGGEDWDDPHVVTGAQLVGLSSIWLTTGGAITSQSSALFTFSKVATGHYRATRDVSEIPGGQFPAVIATVTTDSGAPSFVRVTPWITGGTTQVIDLFTIDAAGDPVNLDSATLTAAFFGIVT